MGFISDLASADGITSIKETPAGTEIGNWLREFVRSQTSGIFGNGAMMQKPGETDAEYNARQAAAVAAGLTAYQDRAMSDGPATTDVMTAFKTGVIGQKIKGYLLPAVLVLGGVVAYPSIKKFFK